jgi:hypothetical protein
MHLAKFRAKSLYAMTAKKVVVDQLVAAPTVVFTVMSAVSLLNGHTVEQTKEKLKNDYFEVLLTNFKVCIPCCHDHELCEIFESLFELFKYGLF